MKFFEGSMSIENDQIDQLFSKKKDSEMDVILKILSIIIYQTSHSTDVVEIYNLLGTEKFSQLVMLLDGRKINLPSLLEFRESLILALIYYYKEMKNYSWEDVKNKIPFDISNISYGIKIKQLNNYLQQKLYEFFKILTKDKSINE